MKDLNLLYVFEAMWRDRSVTAAADNLGLTQAAVSASLKRLRETYGDKLFVLVGRRMEPTAVAMDIAGALLESLNLVRKTTGVPQPFRPEKSQREFTIRTRDIGEVVMLPLLYRELYRVAPDIKLHTMFTRIEDTIPALGNGRIDVALGYLPTLEQDIHRKPLFKQRYVCVMRKGHPMARGPLDMQTFARLDHLLVEYGGSGHLLLERALIEAGAKERIKVRIPQYLAAPHCLLASDLVWVAPEILAVTLCRHYPLIYRPEPLGLEPFEIALYWHDRYHHDPANRWFRSLIVDLFRKEISKPASGDHDLEILAEPFKVQAMPEERRGADHHAPPVSAQKRERTSAPRR
ncbi:LysR family transcriptional regulator [Paraburkholderia oxyphila]|uniref:LysR family transcriptional regulator n=1 Tax=Paraburkholderia oxyphila TaxID=614212 RepID=UPI0009FBEDC1|nr:LysR family transcriptional regulator [Paraburkholderia oxyphila]